MTREQRIDSIVMEALVAWKKSGQKYTCLQSIYTVVDPVIERACANTTIRTRMVRNRVCDIVHNEWKASRA